MYYSQNMYAHNSIHMCIILKTRMHIHTHKHSLTPRGSPRCTTNTPYTHTDTDTHTHIHTPRVTPDNAAPPTAPTALPGYIECQNIHGLRSGVRRVSQCTRIIYWVHRVSEYIYIT